MITSNFEKLRFYIDNAIEHLEFNLFEFTQEQFQLFYLCLAFDNISADIPAKIKAESLSKEDEITKKLYKDYAVFKRELFQNLVAINPDFDPLELFLRNPINYWTGYFSYFLEKTEDYCPPTLSV